MNRLWQDLRYGIRLLAKNPGFTTVAVLTLALGIGANTAIFSVVDTVLLRPLPYPEPDRIVTLWSFWKITGSLGQVSAPDFHDWHDQSTSFDAMAYYQGGETSVSAGSNADFAQVAGVTPEFFRVLGVKAAAGRLFAMEEDSKGGAPVAVLSDAFWQRNFGRSPLALGQQIKMMDRSFTVIGVMPRGFQFPGLTDVWFPAAIQAETVSRSAHNYRVIASLKRGVGLEQAQAQMTVIGARLEQQYPESNKNKNAAVVRMQDQLVSNVRSTLYLLLAAVALILMIACANVANLLLARATSRAREIAIRTAVGATRGRIVRQLMIESGTLALLSGALGAVLASWGTSTLVALAPESVPRLGDAGVDGRVLGFVIFASLASSIFFGLAPALHASRVDLNEALKQGTSRSGASSSAGRIRSALVVAEIALSLVLVASAGLLLKSLLVISGVDLGFRPDHLLVIKTSVPSAGLEGAKRATRFYSQFLERIAATPGVISAAAAYGLPASDDGSNGTYLLEDDPGPEHMTVNGPQAGFRVVTPGYFRTLGIPLKKGRDFDSRDEYDAPFSAIISESLARKSFGNADPIGKKILCGLDSLQWMTIVGVAGDIRVASPTTLPGPEIYMPYLQHPEPATAMHVAVKTAAIPMSLAATLRQTARDLNADVPTQFTSMETMLADSISASRFRAALLGIFAALALCLSMAGVYGVMIYTVSQRTSEIGVRMALGAEPQDILRLVVGHGLRLSLIGVAIGIAGAFALTRLLEGFLYGTGATDPATLAAVCALLLAAALLACWIPARRAMRVDPMVALRYE